MSDKSGQRGRTVKVGEWWSPLAKARVAELKARALQEGRKLSQAQLAAELGVSPSTMTRNLKRNVNVTDVEQLARKLEIPPPVFVPRSEAEARAIQHMLDGMHSQMREHHASLAAIEDRVGRSRSSGATPEPNDGSARKRSRAPRA